MNPNEPEPVQTVPNMVQGRHNMGPVLRSAKPYGGQSLNKHGRLEVWKPHIMETTTTRQASRDWSRLRNARGDPKDKTRMLADEFTA